MYEDIYHDGQAMSAASRATADLALSVAQLGDAIVTAKRDVNYAPEAVDEPSLESVKISQATIEVVGQLVTMVGEVTGLQGSALAKVNQMKNNADAAAFDMSAWTGGGGGGSYRG